jgi:hypothetical protein
VELPGQYLFGHEVNIDNSVLVEGISSNVAIVRRQYSSYRRLSFICSDGRTRHMLVQSGQNALQVGGPLAGSCCIRGWVSCVRHVRPLLCHVCLGRAWGSAHCKLRSTFAGTLTTHAQNWQQAPCVLIAMHPAIRSANVMFYAPASLRLTLCSPPPRPPAPGLPLPCRARRTSA